MQSRDPKQLTAEYSVKARLSLRLNILLFSFVHNGHVTQCSCQLCNQLIVSLSLKLNILLFTFVYNSHVTHGSCQLRNQLMFRPSLRLDQGGRAQHDFSQAWLESA
jgi:hypothetical protein